MSNVMLHVNNVCWLGGTMFHTLTVCKAYPEFKHIVYYIHPTNVNQQMLKMLTDEGIDVSAIPGNGKISEHLFAHHDPALVILNNTGGKFINGSPPFAWLRKWPTVFYHHGPTWPLIHADVDIFNSRHLYESRYTNCHDSMKAIRFIGSYIDADRFDKAPRPRKVGANLAIIGKLASDQAVKFPPNLKTIIDRVDASYGNGAAYEIVGGRKYYPGWGNKYPTYSAPDFGSLPAEDFYTRWDILLYRTTDDYTETWCRIVTEAMASGLAIVAEKKGAIPEQIDHEVNGFLCETDDEFVECLNRFIDSPQLCTAMGLAAREKACREFSIPAFRRKTIDMFMRLMARLPVESEA